MKKSIWTLIIVAALGFAGQSCQTSTDLEDVVVSQEKSTIDSADDIVDKPGGN